MLLKIPQANIVRAHVTRTKQTVQQAAAAFHPTIQIGNHSIVINASNYTSSGVIGQWVSGGQSLPHISNYLDWFGWRPVLCFNPSHRAGLHFRSFPASWYPEKMTIWNGFALVRRGIIDGAINLAFMDNNEINNFLGFGVTAARDLVIYWEDGWDTHHEGLPPKGITKTDGFNALIGAGAVHGGDGGYGGDLGVYIDNQLANEPYNDGEPPRILPNQLCLEVKQLPGQPEPPPPEEPPVSTHVEPVGLTIDWKDAATGNVTRESYDVSPTRN